MFQTRKEDMSVERKPTAFGDLRGWIDALKAHGELQEIDAEVDWNIELGTIMRLAQGPGTGKALLFNNIKDYNKPDTRCRRIFGSALDSYRRIAMMLGLPPDTHPRELVKIGRTILTGSIPPKIVATGPVKENILKGADIDLYEFPSPHWNRLDGGRYLLTYGGCVTKDPETGDHECRHLSRHGRRPRSHPDPDVARPAYRPPLHRLAERRQRRDADRGRDRLGALARLHRRLAGAEGRCASTT